MVHIDPRFLSSWVSKRHVHRVASSVTIFSDQFPIKLIRQLYMAMRVVLSGILLGLSLFTQAPEHVAFGSSPERTPFFEVGGILKSFCLFGTAKLAIAVLASGTQVVTAAVWRGRRHSHGP